MQHPFLGDEICILLFIFEDRLALLLDGDIFRGFSETKDDILLFKAVLPLAKDLDFFHKWIDPYIFDGHFADTASELSYSLSPP